VPTILTGGGVVKPLEIGQLNKVVRVDDSFQILTLNNVLFCPGFSKNIMSLQILDDHGGYVYRHKIFNKFDEPVANLKRHFILDTEELPSGDSLVSKESYTTTNLRNGDTNHNLELWHSRMGHISTSSVKATAKATTGIPHDINSSPDQLICVPCDLGRSLRYTPKPGRPPPDHAGEEWHLDSVKISYPGGREEMYGIIYTEGKYSYRYCDTFQKKEDGPGCILQFPQRAKRQWRVPIEYLQLDGGFELAGPSGGSLDDFVTSEGIHLIISDPYTPEQNGVAERANRIIIEKARIWMIASEADHKLWPYFFDTAVDYTNFTPNNRTKSLNKTPWELFMDENDPGKPHPVDLSNLRTPGCRVYVHIPKQRRIQGEKFNPVAEEGVEWKSRAPSLVPRCYVC